MTSGSSQFQHFNVSAIIAGSSGPIDVIVPEPLDINLTQIAGTAIVNGGVNGTPAVGGIRAHAQSDQGNPVKVGGRSSAIAGKGTVTAEQITDAWFDRLGRLMVVPGDPYNVSARGYAGSFRTLGNAATTHNLLTIENASGSTIIVAVRSIQVYTDSTAALTAVAPTVRISRSAAIPTGGTALTKVSNDPTVANSASVVVRGATASDGGAATAITATAGSIMRQAQISRLHTAVGITAPDAARELLRRDDPPIFITANAGLLVQAVAAAGTSNPATTHWFVSVTWDELTVI